jgi:hypothetical protein
MLYFTGFMDLKPSQPMNHLSPNPRQQHSTLRDMNQEAIESDVKREDEMRKIRIVFTL